MTSRERVLNACAGRPVDFIPASFWGHDYEAEQTAAGLTAQTVEFQRRHGWDFIKINPRAQYHVEDWGVRYEYPAPPGSKCVRTDYPVHGAGHLGRITPLDPERAPVLRQHLDVVEAVAREFPDVPVLMTVFNPLSVLKYASESEQLVVRMAAEAPGALRAALDAARQTFEAFTRAALARGAAGIFLATTAFATHDLWTPADYARWSREDDLALLRAAAGGGFNVLHVCRARNFLSGFRDYPVHGLSWATTEPGNPRLGETPWLRGAAIGGISQETSLQEASSSAVAAEFQAARAATRGQRFILAPGCSIPPSTPAANLAFLRELSRSTQPTA